MSSVNSKWIHIIKNNLPPRSLSIGFSSIHTVRYTYKKLLLNNLKFNEQQWKNREFSIRRVFSHPLLPKIISAGAGVPCRWGVMASQYIGLPHPPELPLSGLWNNAVHKLLYSLMHQLFIEIAKAVQP
jgi:hypothetical protein